MTLNGDVLMSLWIAAVGIAVLVDSFERLAVDRQTRAGLLRLRNESDAVSAQRRYRLGRMVPERELWLAVAMAIVLIALSAVPDTPRASILGMAMLLALFGSKQMSASEFSNQGSDHMRQQMLFCVALAGVPFTPMWLGPAAATGVALAAYVSAGVHKLLSASWRDGQALPGILHAFGSELRLDRRLTASAGWVVMAWELTVPIALFVGIEVALAFLLVGAAFHLANSVALGLTSFFWAFIASYPAIMWVAVELHP